MEAASSKTTPSGGAELALAKYHQPHNTANSTTSKNSTQGTDPEVGEIRPNRPARAYEHREKAKKLFSRVVGLGMVIWFICCILFGPDFNKTHPITLLSPESLQIAYIVSMVSWFICVVLYTIGGEWSKLKGSKRQWHRVICIGMVSAAVILNWIVPDQVQISYAPLVLTLLVEFTYHCVDLVSKMLCCIFLEWIPLLFGNLGQLLLAVWTKIGEWLAFRVDIHVGRQ